MILPFSTQLNGKPTYFVDKIWTSLMDDLNFDFLRDYLEFERLASKELGDKNPFIKISDFKAKKTNIREDKNDRWKPGVMIDFFINARQKNMFRFAPRIPVVSTQEIFMTERGGNLEISIAKEGSYIGSDDKYIYWETKEQLAINDGFDSYEAFQRYFIERIYENEKKTGNKWFSGKIIHWTDLKY